MPTKKQQKPESAKTAMTPLVVTTKHKGVFFGYGEKSDGETIELKQARMCVYWSTDMRGFMGLASIGPSRSCKVGLAVPSLTVRDVTSVAECSPDAATAWEKGPWA